VVGLLPSTLAHSMPHLVDINSDTLLAYHLPINKVIAAKRSSNNYY
jgi:hypothetical protein